MEHRFSLSEAPITVAQYVRLRATAGWWPVAESVIAESLSRSLYSIRADGPARNVIGMGRVVGDPMYMYVQDMIVLPAHRGRGLGRIIMERILDHCGRIAGEGSYLGLMCARGAEPFYAKFGFQRPPPDGPGMQLIQRETGWGPA